MTHKRLEEIKRHFRLFAPKNIQKELSELFKYINKLEDQIKILQSNLQTPLFDYKEGKDK